MKFFRFVFSCNIFENLFPHCRQLLTLCVPPGERGVWPRQKEKYKSKCKIVKFKTLGLSVPGPMAVAVEGVGVACKGLFVIIWLGLVGFIGAEFETYPSFLQQMIGA